MKTKTNTLCHLRYFLIYYKKQFIALLIAIAIVMTIGIGLCYEKKTTYGDGTDINAVVNAACTMVGEMVGSSYQDTKDNLTLTIGDSDVIIGSYTIAGGGRALNTVYTSIQNIALVLLGVFFLAGLMNAMTHQQVDEEFLVKRIAVLIIGIALIGWGNVIIDGTVATSELVMDKVMSAFTDSNTVNAVSTLQDKIVDDCYPEAATTGILSTWIGDPIYDIQVSAKGFIYVVNLLIPWGISHLCSVLVIFSCFSRAVTLCITKGLAPIAFCDLTDGRSGIDNTMRVVKNVFSVAIQGAIILFAVGFCSNAQVSAFNAFIDAEDSTKHITQAFLPCLVLSIVEAGVCLKSHSIAKEIIP